MLLAILSFYLKKEHVQPLPQIMPFVLSVVASSIAISKRVGLKNCNTRTKFILRGE